jgi:hypothetical protein
VARGGRTSEGRKRSEPGNARGRAEDCNRQQKFLRS